jgi:hypothetical protein
MQCELKTLSTPENGSSKSTPIVDWLAETKVLGLGGPDGTVSATKRQ